MRSEKDTELLWFDRKLVEFGEWCRKRLPPVPGPIVDRKWVRERYQQCIWPMLKEQGFDTFYDRGAWRHQDNRIDVVELWFFSRPDMMKWEVTPFSFAIEIGVFFPFIPPMNPLHIKTQSGEILPEAVDCHIRRSPIERQLKQKNLKRYREFWYIGRISRGNRIPNIWYVEPDGNNFEELMEDVKVQLAIQALPWFSKFDIRECINELLVQSQRKRGASEWIEFSHSAGFLALELGQWQLAEEFLRRAADAYPDLKSGRVKTEYLKHLESLLSQIQVGIEKARSELDKRYT